MNEKIFSKKNSIHRNKFILSKQAIANAGYKWGKNEDILIKLHILRPFSNKLTVEFYKHRIKLNLSNLLVEKEYYNSNDEYFD